MSVHLIEPDLGRTSGGLVYNRALAEAAGTAIVRHTVPGSWDRPGRAEESAVAALIGAATGPVVLDGLIATGLPELVGTSGGHAAAGTRPVHVLVHSLAADGPAQSGPVANVAAAAALGSERQALISAAGVITTSRFTAGLLCSRYGIRAEVALPGNPARAQATGDRGGHFICIGAVTENKGQLLIAEALETIAADDRIRDGRRGLATWRCTFAGPIVEADYAHRLRSACAELQPGRAGVVGELAEDELDALYDSADLLLLPSRSEAYGMVVAEAAAAGIPAFATAGTGAEEPLRAGLSLPRDRGSWAGALRRWADDDRFRTRLREEAQQRREEAVRGWDRTATDVLRALAGQQR